MSGEQTVRQVMSPGITGQHHSARQGSASGNAPFMANSLRPSLAWFLFMVRITSAIETKYIQHAKLS